jgi:hypothetical protein
MKTLHSILLILSLFMGGSLLWAQTLPATNPSQDSAPGVPPLGTPRVEKLAEAEANYLRGLISDNPGLVESSLCYAVQLQLAFPDMNFWKLENAVDLLMTDGQTAGIRYKASLASIVFASPRLVDDSLTSSPTDVNGYFASIAEQLSDKLLVHTQKK